MLRGFNAYIDFLTGKEYCPSGGLFENPLKWNPVKEALSAFPADRKVLRFPGGTGSRTWQYTESDISAFKTKCAGAGVTKTTFVVNLSDIHGSMMAARKIAETLEIVLIEAGNEEYDHARNPKGWGEIFTAWLNVGGWFRTLGREYGNQVNEVINNFKPFFPDVPIGVTINVPNDSKNTGWWNGIRDKVLNAKDVIIHPYRNPGDESYISNLHKNLGKLGGTNKWYTEFNIKYEPGGYQYMAYTGVHKILFNGAVDYLTLRDDTKMILLHSLWGHHLFAAWSWKDDTLTYNYENWGL